MKVIGRSTAHKPQATSQPLSNAYEERIGICVSGYIHSVRVRGRFF